MHTGLSEEPAILRAAHFGRGRREVRLSGREFELLSFPMKIQDVTFEVSAEQRAQEPANVYPAPSQED